MKKLLILILLFIAVGSNAQNIPTYDVATKVFSVYDSLSTAVDTLSKIDTLSNTYDRTWKAYNTLDKTFKYWFQFVVATDSTTVFSTRSDFATGSTFEIKAGESFTSPKFGLEIVNLYFKIKGTGKCLRRLMLFGN